MLVALKKQLAPTDYTRKLELVYKYNKLKTFLKKEDVEKQLKDQEVTYIDRKELDILKVVDNRPLFDFIYTILLINSRFVLTQEYFINQKARKLETLLDLYNLIKDFCNYY